MSTKIHNGFLFAFSHGFGYQGALEDLQKLRDELKPVVDELYGATLLELAVGYIDGQHKGQDLPTGSPVSRAHRELRNRQKEIKTTGYRDPMVDFGFEVSLLPLKQGKHSSFLLGIYHTEQEKFAEALKAKHWFIEYGYWNNSDRPDDVSKAEWARRKKDWDTALPGAGIPSMHGFNFTLVSNDLILPPRLEDILHMQPSVSDRAKAIAQDLLWKEWAKGKEIEKDATSVVHEMMEFESSVLRKDAPRRAEYDSLRAEWETKLKPFTVADLYPE